MYKALTLIPVFMLGIVTLFAPSSGGDTVDEAEVRKAVSDYVEGIYNVQPERIDASVDTTLRKMGYWRPDDSNEYRPAVEMSFNQLRNLAANWNKSGWLDVETATNKITILDVMDKTASAKLEAYWGVDYFHLSKQDGTWKIVNVIWQSYPPSGD